MSNLALIENVKKIFNSVNINEINPSLYLDKFTKPVETDNKSDYSKSDNKKENNEEKSKSYKKLTLKKISDIKTHYQEFKNRWELLGKLSHFTSKTFETKSPFTLHLSRTTPLENVGICFHPLYGFVYIPGSGIKGLARAYAEQVWLNQNNLTEEDKKNRKNLIKEIFGSDNTHNPSAGKVVFHDAYPETFPELKVEISNCHHPDYYAGKNLNLMEGGETGDWENPNPVYFLSVKPGAKFIFALSIRQDLKNINQEEATKLINKAWEFLAGGLVHMGLGAKTSSGFGVFNVDKVPQDDLNQKYKVGNYKLIFQTPVFAARILDKDYLSMEDKIKKDRRNNRFSKVGNIYKFLQTKEDGDIEISTLKGQLRWWWRTIYSSTLSAKELLLLESAIWGSINQSSPIRIIIKENKISAEVFKEENKKKMSYITYGIGEEVKIKEKDKKVDENIKEELAYYLLKKGKTNDLNSIDKPENFFQQLERYYIEENSYITIEVHCEDSYIKLDEKKEIKISKQQVFEQFQFSLYLLSKYGGLGAKSRKGFGSFKVEGNIFEKIDEEKIKSEAKELMKKIFNKKDNEVKWTLILDENQLSKDLKEAPFDAKTSLEALEKLNKIYFNFCKSQGGEYKNTQEYRNNRKIKAVFGLPRKDYDLPNHPSNSSRHASPIHFHLEPANNGKWLLRMSIFPSKYLINKETCENFLKEFANYVKDYINNVQSSSNNFKNYSQKPNHGGKGNYKNSDPRNKK